MMVRVKASLTRMQIDSRRKEGETDMKKYNNPIIEILLFDEEDIVTASGTPESRKAVNSFYQLNDYFFKEKKADGTTSVKLQDIQVK